MSTYQDEDAEVGKGDAQLWICRLEIDVGAVDPLYGTGFLVNFRDSTKNIIMTAGHNIFHEKKHVRSITVVFQKGLLQQDDVTKVTAEGNQLFVSEEFKNDPENDVEDYGLIVLGGRKLGGYAFSALITDVTLKKINLIGLAGYSADLAKLERGKSSLAQIGPRQLSYRVSTVPGMSGSPVWVDYQYCDTVIGIHNHDQGQGKGISGFRCTRLTHEVLLVMVRWAGSLRLDVPICTQVTSDSEKHYLRISNESPQGGRGSTFPRALVCIPLEGDQLPNFNIIPMQAPEVTVEAPENEEDANWEHYLYVVSPVVPEGHAKSFLGHTSKNPGTPSDRKNILHLWPWSQEEAAKKAGWILFRPKGRRGFSLMRTSDMGKTASSGGQVDRKDLEVLAFSNLKLPQKYACGRRRETGDEDGLTFMTFNDNEWRKLRFNADLRA